MTRTKFSKYLINLAEVLSALRTFNINSRDPGFYFDA